MQAFKFRIYPTLTQKTLLAKHFGSCRFVFNHFLEERNKEYKQTGDRSTYVKDCAKLTKLKNNFPWLSEINAQSLQSSVKNLDISFGNFFKKRANFPKFKNRYNKQSFKGKAKY